MKFRKATAFALALLLVLPLAIAVAFAGDPPAAPEIPADEVSADAASIGETSAESAEPESPAEVVYGRYLACRTQEQAAAIDAELLDDAELSAQFSAYLDDCSQEAFEAYTSHREGLPTELALGEATYGEYMACGTAEALSALNGALRDDPVLDAALNAYLAANPEAEQPLELRRRVLVLYPRYTSCRSLKKLRLLDLELDGDEALSAAFAAYLAEDPARSAALDSLRAFLQDPIDAVSADAEVTSSPADSAKTLALHSVLADGAPFSAFEISSAAESAVLTVRLPADFTEGKSAVFVNAFHLLDSAAAIAAEYERCSSAVKSFVPEDAALFPRELAAAADYDGIGGKVYYTFAFSSPNAEGEFSFRVESFSTFAFSVDFQYGDFTFSLGGGDEVLLSTMFEALHIDRQVSDVAEVTFTNPEYIEVSRTADGDWKLRSLAPFESEERLDVRFTDDSEIEINVTDPPAIPPNIYQTTKARYHLLNSFNDLTTYRYNSSGTVNNVTIGTLERGDKYGTLPGHDYYVSNSVAIRPIQLTGFLTFLVRPGTAIRFEDGCSFEITKWHSENYWNHDGIWRLCKADSIKYVTIDPTITRREYFKMYIKDDVNVANPKHNYSFAILFVVIPYGQHPQIKDFLHDPDDENFVVESVSMQQFNKSNEEDNVCTGALPTGEYMANDATITCAELDSEEMNIYLRPGMAIRFKGADGKFFLTDKKGFKDYLGGCFFEKKQYEMNSDNYQIGWDGEDYWVLAKDKKKPDDLVFSLDICFCSFEKAYSFEMADTHADLKKTTVNFHVYPYSRIRSYLYDDDNDSTNGNHVDPQWNLKTVSRTLTEPQEGRGCYWNGEDTPTYRVNEVAIEIGGDGPASTYDDTWQNIYPNGLHVFARPGSAVAFAGGCWFADDAWGKKEGNPYALAWTETEHLNYVTIDPNITEVTTFLIQIRRVNWNSTTNPNYDPAYNVVFFVIPFIPFGDDPQLVREQISDSTDLSSRYEVVDIPATLYNYDGNEFNKRYRDIRDNHYDNWQDYSFLGFRGGSQGIDVLYQGCGWCLPNKWDGLNYTMPSANGKGGQCAHMGLVENQLNSNTHLPVFYGSNPVDFFSTDEFSGKEVYEDLGFEFIYEKDTHYYTYSSDLNHAQFSKDAKKIELYDTTMGAAFCDEVHHGDRYFYHTHPADTYAGFYPFSDIKKAFLNYPWSTDLPTGDYGDRPVPWNDNLAEDFSYKFARYTTGMVSPHYLSPTSPVDMHYGLKLEAPFYLPADKKLDGKDMTYSFSGDDDLWVFIDDTLVLDIGGGHTAIWGKFNLTNGKVEIQKYAKIPPSRGGRYGNAGGEQVDDLLVETSDFLTGLQGDKIHTLRVFYLERYSGVSNCRMRFNLPVVPQRSITVAKKVVGSDNSALSCVPDEDYTFQIWTAQGDNDTIDATTFSALAGWSYTIEGDTGTHQTDGNGNFKLKDGQKAIFADIPRFTEVYVKETVIGSESLYTHTGPTVTQGGDDINYTNNQTATLVMPNTSLNYEFTNKLAFGTVVVRKEVEGGADGLINPNQQFSFILNVGDGTHKVKSCTFGSLNNSSGVVTAPFDLQQGEQQAFGRIPVGLPYKLTEQNPGSGFDPPKYTLNGSDKGAVNFGSYLNCETVTTGDNNVTVTNQQFITLTITKNIDGDAAPDESFMFNVEGKSGPANGINIDVVIPSSKFQDGTASIKVNRLPVGEYTVKEKHDWSWRYTLQSSSTLDNQKPSTCTPTVTFTNKRDKEYWLDGDCHGENKWNGDNGNVTP